MTFVVAGTAELRLPLDFKVNTWSSSKELGVSTFHGIDTPVTQRNLLEIDIGARYVEQAPRSLAQINCPTTNGRKSDRLWQESKRIH